MPPVLGKEIYKISIVFDFEYMSLLSSLFLTEKGLYFFRPYNVIIGKETIKDKAILLNKECKREAVKIPVFSREINGQ
ncbi:MAG: hypothetical protein M0P14_02550 [Alkaliphilus sp.]|nr:hypothetical protein [Alkaliphilus sp.]